MLEASRGDLIIRTGLSGTLHEYEKGTYAIVVLLFQTPMITLIEATHLELTP